MTHRDYIFWAVDVQRDFVLPGGKLYVSGAEKLLPNIRALSDAARNDEVFLVSSGDFHPPDDPEFQQFPPHCVKGTTGAELLPDVLCENFFRLENTDQAKLPSDLFRYQQIIVEKQTLDVFQTRHADELVRRLGDSPEFVVFGVVTEYCVHCAAKGLLARNRRVSIVRDAIETLDPRVGMKTVAELENLGARVITTSEALSNVSVAK